VCGIKDATVVVNIAKGIATSKIRLSITIYT
jgi:hypothetical protein